MFRRTMIAMSALAIATLAGCGTTSKPLAGTPAATGSTPGRARIDDPRTTHVKCLQDKHIHVKKVGQTGLQIGSAPGGATVDFAPTPGAAQERQISGTVQSAEVIGSALLYPNQTPDGQLKVIEDCLAVGVSG